MNGFKFSISTMLVACGLFCSGCSTSTPSAEAPSAAPAAQATPTTLTIAEKNRVAAPKESEMILLLDFYPNKPALLAAGAGATPLIEATAEKYAGEYLAKAEYKAIPKVIVYVVFVDSMDEYNRQNFSGMKRFGTLTYERSGAGIKRTENKLAFTP